MHFSLNNWELLKKGCARLFLIKCQISGKEMPVLASRSASSLKSGVHGYFAGLLVNCIFMHSKIKKDNTTLK